MTNASGSATGRIKRVRIGDVWYGVAYQLPKPLLDESGRSVNLVLDRLGILEYGSSRDVDEVAERAPRSPRADCG